VNQQLVILKHVTAKNILEEILRDIIKQVLETKYTLNLGQLLWAIPDIKCYILNSVPSKPTIPKPTVTLTAIDLQMEIIQVQVGKNFIKDVLPDGGFGVNIITKKLRVQLDL
jgi:hypothetical protein